MEMQNSALLQMMQTQNLILGEIRSLREKEALQGAFVSPDTSTLTPIDSSTASMSPPPSGNFDMFQGGQYYNTLSVDPYNFANQSMANAQVAPLNPTLYGTIASAPVIGQPIDLTKTTIEDAIAFNPSRMSKEQMSEHIAQRSQSIQESVVGTAGKGLEMAGLASGFFMGGLLPSLAVGGAVAGATAYVAGSMMDGVRDAHMYQDILRKDGYKAFNAFESTTEFGGLGINLDDQQELSGFLRDLSDDMFLEDAEMAQILQGGLDNKLLKSVTDIKSFKERMKKLTESVKEISITLNQTIDETIEFMGEMERRGVSMDRMSNMSAQFKIGASMTGTDASQFAAQAMSFTDAIVSGTSMDAGNVMEGISANAYLVNAISEVSADGDGIIKQYIKNLGGETAVAGQVEQNSRAFMQSAAGQQQLLAMFAPAFVKDESTGRFNLDESRLREIASGGQDIRQLLDQSSQHFRSLTASDQDLLAQSAGQIFNQSTDSFDSLIALKKMQEQFMADGNMSAETALVKMGVAQDYNAAAVLNQTIIAGTNEDAITQFDARVAKEEMDSAARAKNPGIGTRFKYFFERNLANPLGDAGQWLGDVTGDISEDVQMTLAGIEEGGIIGGDLLPEFTESGLQSVFTEENSVYNQTQKSIEQFNEFALENNLDTREFREMRSDHRGRLIQQTGDIESKDFKEEFSYEQFEQFDKRFDEGKATSADIATLREMLDSGNYDEDSRERLEYLVNRESGSYSGVKGTGKRALDWIGASWDWEQPERPESDGGYFSIEDIERMQKSLQGELEKASGDLDALMGSGTDLGTKDYEALERAVRTGNVDEVRKLGATQDVLGIAERFKELNAEGANVKGISDSYNEMVRFTAASGEYAKGMTDFMLTSGSLDESEASAYKKIEDEIRDRTSKEAINNMDAQEMYETNQWAMQRLEDTFVQRSYDDIATDAEKLLEENRSLDASSLYVDGQEGVYDAYKLFDALMNFQRQQQAGSSVAEETLGGNGSGEDVANAAGDRADAMGDFLTTIVDETTMLRQAVEDVQTGNSRRYTRVGSGG